MNRKTTINILLLIILLLSPIIAETVQEDFPQNEFIAAISTDIPNLHPHAAYNADEAQILTGLYEGLCIYDPYTLQPRPGLAKSWQVSSDGLTWTFMLRENLLFENGDTINAKTFYDSFINLLNPSLNLPYASLLDCVKGVKEYRSGQLKDKKQIGFHAESERSFQISLVHPAEHLANILCHHAFSAVHPSQLQSIERFAGKNIFKEPAQAFKPISSGPFKIDRFTREKIRLIKNPAYWDETSVMLPAISLLLNNKTDETAEAFNQGHIHWLDNVPVNKIAAAHTIHITPMFATEYLYFRTDRNPCETSIIRDALAAALPYEDIRKGYLIPAKTLIFPLAGYPAAKGLEKTDIQKAETLLKKIPATKELPPLKIVLPQTSFYNELADMLKTAWEKLGIPVEAINIPFEEYYDSLKTKDYHVALVSWIGDFADPLAFLELFRPESALNNACWKNNDYENLIKKAAAESDRKKRFDYLSKAEQLLLDSSVIIPLSHIPAINVIDLAEIKGWYTNAVNIHPFKFIRFVQPDPLPGIAMQAAP